MRNAAATFASDRRGVTAVEFGLIAPMLMVALMGLLDLGYNVYTDAQLQGAIQKAARDSTIEGASTEADTLDARVTAAVRIIAPQATITFSRQAYASFSDVRQPEDFSDTNNNGTCDTGESFEDANGNGTWDADRGESGGSQAGCNPKPGLLPNFHDNAIIHFLDGDGHGCLPARHGIRARTYLHDHFLALPKSLRSQISPIELTKQSLGNIHWFNHSVKNFSFHEVDYNRLCDSP